MKYTNFLFKRRNSIMLLCFLCCTTVIVHAVRLEIENEAGELRRMLPKALFDAGGVPIAEVTTFAVNGTVNGADLNYIKENQRNFPALDTLDLGKATFEPVTIDGILYPADMLAPNTFEAFRTLSCIYLPETLKRIGTKAFAGCSAMKIMPNSVEIIDNEAFPWARSLGDVVTSTSLRTVGDGAWAYCDGDTGECGLNNIEFPSLDLESFGHNVFQNCDLLESVTILKPTPPTAGSFGSNLGKKVGKKPILWVLEESVDAYKNINVYNDAFEIRSISEQDITSIQTNTINDAVVFLENNTLNVNNLTGEKTTVSVYDCSGKIISQQQTTEEKLPIFSENWNYGVYIICLENVLGESKVIKIIK